MAAATVAAAAGHASAEDADKVSTASVMEKRIEEVTSELAKLEQEVREDYVLYLR